MSKGRKLTQRKIAMKRRREARQKEEKEKLRKIKALALKITIAIMCINCAIAAVLALIIFKISEIDVFSAVLIGLGLVIVFVICEIIILHLKTKNKD